MPAFASPAPQGAPQGDGPIRFTTDLSSLGSSAAEAASREFAADVRDRVRRYTNTDNPSLGEIAHLIMESMARIATTENSKIAALEALAVALVREDLAVPAGSVIIDAKIAPSGSLDPLPILPAVQDTSDPADMELALSKRRIINALIQGGARKGQYLFHLATDQVMPPHEKSDYGTFMSLNELVYLLFPPELITLAAAFSSERIGSVRLDFSREHPVIIARGINFAVLTHELTKGVLELMACHGLPHDGELRRFILARTEHCGEEARGLKVGAALWERFLAQLPVGVVMRRAELFSLVCQLPDREFHALIDDLLSNERQASIRIDSLVRQLPRS